MSLETKRNETRAGADRERRGCAVDKPALLLSQSHSDSPLAFAFSESHCHFDLAACLPGCLPAAAQSLILFKALPDDSLWPKSKTWPIHEVRVPVSHLFEPNWKPQENSNETRRHRRRSSRNLMGYARGEVSSSSLRLLANTSTYT